MKLEHVKHIGIIGTGMIGTSLAVLFTGHGYRTTLYVLNDELEVQSRQKFDDSYRELAKHGFVTEKQIEICRKYLSYTRDYKDLSDADYIFECVFEQIPVKHSVYREIEKYVREPKAIISTTSTFAVDNLSEGLDIFRDRMIVAHPFYPPHLIPFFEVVKGASVKEQTVDGVVELLKSADREVAVLKKSVPGFIANRLQHALFREAIYIVENGIADARAVDKAAMYSFMPRYTSIGIFEHLDNSGVDLNYNIENYLFKDLSSADKAPKLICDLMEQKAYGVKSGRGVYDWSNVDMKDFSDRISAPYWRYFNWELPEE